MDDITLPEGAEIFLYNPDYSKIRGPYNEDDIGNTGIIVSPVVQGEELIVEIDTPNRAETNLWISAYYHDYRGFGARDYGMSIIYIDGESPLSDWCNIDVACTEGDGWRDQIRAVVIYTLAGQVICSGTLMNNTTGDKSPYILTANHCVFKCGSCWDGWDEEAAQLVNVYFNYQNSTCRGHSGPGSASGYAGDGTDDDIVMGTNFRAKNEATDMTLLEIDEEIPMEYDIYYAGWDKTGAVGFPTVGISHPRGCEKRIAIDDDDCIVAPDGEYLDCDPAYWPGCVDSNFIKVVHDEGMVQGGSSGSGLFNPEKRVVGFLSGGTVEDPMCDDRPFGAFYGRLSSSWEGTSSSTRLKDWLGNNTTIGGIDGCRYYLHDHTYTAILDIDGCLIETEDVVLASTADASFTALDYIKLKSGTHIVQGASFQASID